MADYKEIPAREYMGLSWKIKEIVGTGIVAVVGVGRGGTDFFDEYLDKPFGYTGINFSSSMLSQLDKTDDEGYRFSWFEENIPSSLKKAIVIERSVESGKSLLSADVYLLEMILEGHLNLEEIYNLTARDEADLGHFQAVGKNNYENKDGRSIFKEILEKQLPHKYDELALEGEDIFSRISDIPHMRLREIGKSYEKDISGEELMVVENSLSTLANMSLEDRGEKKNG
jgi:hypothetical protein